VGVSLRVAKVGVVIGVRTEDGGVGGDFAGRDSVGGMFVSGGD
jgi:hypothetical protein